MTRARLAEVTLPDFGMPDVEPEIPTSLYAERVERLRERAAAAGHDRLVVYADREHSASLAYLTGFDPQFEEAVLVLGPTGDPVILAGNECMGMAAAAPLPMRPVLLQDLSLPSQPRDRSQPLAEILGRRRDSRGQPRRGGRLEDLCQPRDDRCPRLPGGRAATGHWTDGRGGERHRPADRRRRRPAGDQRGRAAGRVRVRRLPDVAGRAPPAVRPASGHDGAGGGPPARLERHAALVSPDGLRRSTGPVRPSLPRRPADRTG